METTRVEDSAQTFYVRESSSANCAGSWWITTPPSNVYYAECSNIVEKLKNLLRKNEEEILQIFPCIILTIVPFM